MTDQRPDLAVVDHGYRGHGEDKTRVLISGTRRGLTPKLITDLRRRSAIEAEIGHMKTDSRLSRCPLKGIIGDAVFAALCACGPNCHRPERSGPQTGLITLFRLNYGRRSVV